MKGIEVPVKLAVVVPIFNEQDTLPELSRRLSAVGESLSGCEWQVVYVSDGSTDGSERLIGEQHQLDPRFTLVMLSRNFGHQAAIAAGVEHAKDADALVLMDGDLQDPPEVIPQLVAAWREGAEVVLAQRRSRRERWPRSWGLAAFYRVFEWLTDYPIPANVGIFCLLNRAAADELSRLTEHNRFLPGLRCWIGFDQRTVMYDRLERAAGKPKQSLGRLFRYAFDAIFSFSYKPLRLLMAFGVLVGGCGFLLSCWYVGKRLLGYEQAVTGFTTLITMLLFLGGVQLIAIGVLGEYLGRIYDEVKQRPSFIVRKRLGISAPPRHE